MPQVRSADMRKFHTQDMKNSQNSRKGRDRIKIIVLTAIVLILLALDWAALHDILKGEPNLYLEYAVVMFSIILISAVIFITLKRKKRRVNIT